MSIILNKTLIFSMLFFFASFAPISVFGSTLLKDFKGEFRTVEDYKNEGRWLIVMLWASDCHVCNQEAHEYVKFHSTHANKDAQMLGISLDGESTKADAIEFMQKHKLNFPSLIGEPETVAQMYQNLTGNAWVGTPTFLVYGPDGELRGQQVGAVPTSVIESFIARESAANEASSSSAKTGSIPNTK